MKRIGVQLAGSGIVVLLGALGVAQAQRDSGTVDSTQWEESLAPSLTPPPAPIAAVEPEIDELEMAASGPSTLGLGAFSPPPIQPETVRTVSHDEPLDASISPASIGLPVASDSDNPSVGTESPALSLPAWSMPAAEQPSQAPQENPPAAPPAGTAATLPTLQFDTAPANGLRDEAAIAAPTYESNVPAENESYGAAMPLPPSAPPPSLDSQSTASTLLPAAQLHPIEVAEAATPIAPLSSEPQASVASRSTAGLALASPTTVDRLEDSVLAEPGDRRLEGSQSPSIVIQKRAPEEVKVGKPATFVIYLQNTGGVEALDVRVHDRIPVGTRLVDTSPQPSIQGDLLTWELGAIEPGGERTVTVQLIPEQEGELGSVARVTFEAAASVRTISTRPELKISQRAPEKVLIGQQLEIEIEVSNPGSGAATGVVLQEDVPEGLEHPKGRQLDNVIGTLAPGEVRRQVLRMRATAPGRIANQVRLVGDDGLTTENTVMVDVVAPQLAIELEGPSRKFLERQAEYNINLANVGTADATNVEVVAYLDRGFSFVATEYQGQYDPSRHAVYWSLAELPADGRGSVPLTLLPIEAGERAIRLEAKGDLNALAQHEKIVNVDTLAELSFSITDDADPIEIGRETTYEITISNRGSRDDSNVKLQMMLPPGLELVASETEASTDDRGLIAFAPTATLAAGRDTVHRIRVRGVLEGTQVVKAIVTSAEATVPVTKEESTMVYSDK